MDYDNKGGPFYQYSGRRTEYASYLAFQEYAVNYISALSKDDDYMTIRFSLEKFADELVDSLCENGMSICVFPVSDEDRGKIVGVDTFDEDLAIELENYM